MQGIGRRWLVPVAAMLLARAVGGFALADEAVPTKPQPRWWKGNLHTHTFWSDGDDFPEMVAEWYRTHGYNFLALSDHNVLAQGIRWGAKRGRSSFSKRAKVTATKSG
jgi:hypothetical protein